MTKFVSGLESVVAEADQWNGLPRIPFPRAHETRRTTQRVTRSHPQNKDER